MLDIIGARLDQRPAPIIYVGPTKDFLTDQFEPRLMGLLDEAETLKNKVVRGRRMKKTLKHVAGVRVRLAHAGSSSALKSDPAALALIDEFDEMMANVKGQGDVLGLVEARGETYADFVTAITSTPARGLVEIELDEDTGLEFWAISEPDDLESPIWKLFQEGTRHHWAWPCRHCEEYFVPRFKQLRWPDRATPAQAKRDAYLECPRCGGVHTNDDKEWMNARGTMVAPGQNVVLKDDEPLVTGAPEESSTLSMWTSGLCSPFVTWGQRAETYLTALQSGDHDRIQTAMNASFGECYSMTASGDVPEWQEIMERRLPYQPNTIPDGGYRLVMGVDVQKFSLIYVIRAFGARGTSWLIDSGQLYGPTDDNEVWNALADLMLQPIAGMHILKVFIDSGFRPDKPELGNEHKVYEFCRRYHWLCSPTKGKATQNPPYKVSRQEVKPDGKRALYSINLVMLSSDYFKSLVISRLRTPMDEPGAFYVHEDVSEDYCKQLTSESRVIVEGKPVWVKRSRHNHFLDCFDGNTELLTESGWLSVADAVSYAGKFATVNLDTDLIEYQHATNSVARWHEGEMVRIKGRSVDLLVTPNHRMVTYRRNPVDRTARITEAKDLTIWHTLKRSSNWDGTRHQSIALPALTVKSRNGKVLSEPERVFDAGDWCEFLGWFVSNGHITRRGLHHRVVLSQSTGDKSERIANLLDRMGLKYRVYAGRQFYVASRQLALSLSDCYADECTTSDGKKVPEFVRSCSSQLIERFLDAAVLGDGWTQHGARHFASTSRELSNGIQELFLKIGRSANLVERGPQTLTINGRVSTNTVTQYHVSEIKSEEAHLRRSDNSALFDRTPYSGMVYCVTVPNGTLIARRNGKAMFVGNCEALCAAIGYALNVQRIPEGTERNDGKIPDAENDAPPEGDPPPSPPAHPRGGGGGAGLRNRFAHLGHKLNR
jgi:phage terminase large subunit GpA-like protein